MHHRLRAGLIALATFIAATGATAQTQRVTLDNGLSVIAVQSTHSNVAAIGVVIDCSIADEPTRLHGARALLQQAVVIGSHEQIRQRGAPVSSFVDPRSSGLTVNTDWDMVEVAFAVHTEEFEQGLSLIAEHLFADQLTQETLDRARELVAQGYDRSHDSPVQTTFDLFRAAFYGNHPMGRPLQGDPAALDDVGVGALQGFRDTYYVPSRAHLCVISPTTPPQTLAGVEEALGGLPAGPETEPPERPDPPAASLVEPGESADLVQASLVVGVPMPPYGSEEYIAAEMIAALLDGRGGRLRRDLSLLQGLGLAIPSRLLRDHYPIGTLPLPTARRPYLAVHALCSPQAIEDTRRGLLRHLLALRTGTVTDEELERARRRVINAHRLTQQYPADAALYLARRDMFGLGGADAAVAACEAVTREDLTSVATKHFTRHAVGLQMPAPGGRMAQ